MHGVCRLCIPDTVEQACFVPCRAYCEILAFVLSKFFMRSSYHYITNRVVCVQI